jgi:hypothetical protein
MAKDIKVDELAKWAFWITFAGCVAYVAAVAVFVLSSEPSSVPQSSEHPR